MAEAVGDRTFTSAELIRHADVHPALKAQLDGALVDSPRQLGKLLASIEGRSIQGLMLERVDETREGILWRVRVSQV